MVRDVTGIYREFGDERLPPGQHRTESFPVLSKGNVPRLDREEWTLSVGGAVENPVTLDWGDFLDLGVETQRQDFHCVTGWSKFDCEFTGVPLTTLADHVGVDADVVHVMLSAADDYTTDLPLSACLRPETLLARPRGDSPPIRLQRREVGDRRRVPDRTPTRLLGTAWLLRQREPVETGAIQLAYPR